MLRRHYKRLTAKLIIVAVAALTFTIYYQFFLNSQKESADLIAYANELSLQMRDSLLAEIKCTEQAVHSASAGLTKQLYPQSTQEIDSMRLKVLVTTIMETCKDLAGVVIALERDGHLDSSSVCVLRKKDSFLHFRLSTIYNTPEKLLQAPWHMLPNGNTSGWVAPYYSINAKQKNAAYIATVTLANNIKCYVVAAYTTNDIYNQVNRWKSGRLGYPYIVNQNGDFIAHPADDNRTLLEIGKQYNESTLIRLANDIKEGKLLDAWNYYHLNTVSKAMCWEHVIPIERLGWFLGISVTDQQVYSNPSFFNQQRKHKILLSLLFFGAILFIEILVFSLLFKKADMLKLTSIAISIFFALEIVLMFMVSLRYPSYNFSDMDLHSLLPNKNYPASVSSKSSKDDIQPATWHSRWNYSMLLDNEGTADYIRTYLSNFNKKSSFPFMQIPTGIYIKTVRFTDSYATTISGYLWQLYPTALPVKHGVMLPDAETSCIELIDSATVILPNYQKAKFYRWHFTADIREQYTFKHYPFDYNALWLRIWSIDFENNVILIPDFRAYKLLHPSFNPGLDNDITLAGWNIKGSYFSFKEKSYNANFDPDRNLARASFPELNFNIIIKREYFDSIITRMIPLLVLLFMTYSILCISKREDALNVAIACSGLLFIAVLEHVNLRRNLESSGLIYMEYYYFVTYFLLMFVSVNIVLNIRFSKLLSRPLNISRLSTIAFWPIALLLIFIATAVTFF